MSPHRSADERFTEFAHAYGDRLFRTALMLTADWHLAEDLTQVTLAKAYASWRRVERAGDPVAYVRGVLVKTWLSHLRKRSTGERPVDSPVESTSAPPDSPEVRVAVLTALAELAPRDRAVLVLRFFEDRSIDQTAHDLDMSRSAVTTATARALSRAREAFVAHGLHLPDSDLDFQRSTR